MIKLMYQNVNSSVPYRDVKSYLETNETLQKHKYNNKILCTYLPLILYTISLLRIAAQYHSRLVIIKAISVCMSV